MSESNVKSRQESESEEVASSRNRSRRGGRGCPSRSADDGRVDRQDVVEVKWAEFEEEGEDWRRRAEKKQRLGKRTSIAQGARQKGIAHFDELERISRVRPDGADLECSGLDMAKKRNEMSV